MVIDTLRKAAKRVYTWAMLPRANRPAQSANRRKQIAEQPNDYLVSIIIPVYNHQEFLAECINSAIAQSYRKLEIIIVDDCSTQPEVQQILRKFRGRPGVKLFRNPHNLGISGTQNQCLAYARGEVIGFLDCDDRLEPYAVEESLAYWSPETVYSYTNRIHIDEQGQELDRFSCDHLPKVDLLEEQLDLRMYASHFKLIKKEAFQTVGLFNSAFDGAQDYDMALRMASEYPTSAFVHVPSYLYRHRIHSRQVSKTAKQQQITLSIEISNQARRRRAMRNGKRS